MLTFILAVFALLVLFTFSVLIVGHRLSVPGYKGPVTDHFDGKKFHNPSGMPAKGFREVFKFMREERGNWVAMKPTSEKTDPVQLDQDSDDSLAFVNHSTFLIQLDGKNILTDPIWSDRCSPFQWAGPKRLRPPGMAFEDLPKIDIVLLSHNHYDHLDIHTVRRLKKMFNPLFITSLGVGNFLTRKGISNVTEIDWWESISTHNLNIMATPANHFSGRGIFDRDTTLWSGFTIDNSQKKVYFTGDSGYSSIFKEIGQKIKDVDVALIPIGAYEPRWFMSPIHVAPDEAVQIHLDIMPRQSYAMHFGTFPLANEGSGQAEKELKAALNEAGLSSESFIIPKEGKTYTI